MYYNVRIAYILYIHEYIHMCISGSQLTKCTFNGQQCCSQRTLDFFGGFITPAIESDTFSFDGAFNGARTAINQLRRETGGTYMDIIT